MSDDHSIRKFNHEAFYGKKKKHEFDLLSERIMGAVIQVHRELGPGFLESIYEEALKVELSKSQIKYEHQKEITIKYRDAVVGSHRVDMIVENQIILELKVTKDLVDVHYAQLRSYIKATDFKIGLLLNFAKPTVEIKRIVN